MSTSSKLTRRRVIAGSAATSLSMAAAMPAQSTGSATVERYVRFQTASMMPAWGIVQDENVRALDKAPYLGGKPRGRSYPLKDVKLLAPAAPPKVLAVGLNYKSHIGNRPAPKEPEIFYKPTTCLQHPGDPIVIPSGAQNVHYEGELVLLIGKGGKNFSLDQAREAIFGVTCGNDVSERDWQNGAQKDLQWWRAKGADTFGPVGPQLVRGIDYSKLLLQTRLNGEVVQKQSTSDLLFDAPTIVQYVSKYVTLETGDLIFTGTPGSTRKMSPGDKVEVEIQSVGVLANPIK